ncbi:MAG: porin family protein [Acidobacteriota bacterium]|nr:porin family protein [Acidobacteriota bacterium]
MRSVSLSPARRVALPLVALGALLLSVAPVSAQGFGVGGRLAWLKADSDVDVDTPRLVGGQVRLVTGRLGLEVSMDRRSEEFELLNEKVTETPIQTSLLLRMGSGRVAPYLLGGPGWYRREVEALDDPELRTKTTEFGWHAGLGLEILASKHFGIHGDYRYTFLGDDDEDDDDEDDDGGFLGRFVPGHRGSMWTLGATIYF